MPNYTAKDHAEAARLGIALEDPREVHELAVAQLYNTLALAYHRLDAECARAHCAERDERAKGEKARRWRNRLLWLLAIACGLLLGQARAGVIESEIIWTSGPVQYTWVSTPDYGYQPISLDGIPVNGITFGFNPMPPFSGSSALDIPAGALDLDIPNLPSVIPEDSVHVTPEPGFALLVFAALLLGILARGSNRKQTRNRQ